MSCWYNFFFISEEILYRYNWKKNLSRSCFLCSYQDSPPSSELQECWLHSVVFSPSAGTWLYTHQVCTNRFLIYITATTWNCFIKQKCYSRSSKLDLWVLAPAPDESFFLWGRVSPMWELTVQHLLSWWFLESLFLWDSCVTWLMLHSNEHGNLISSENQLELYNSDCALLLVSVEFLTSFKLKNQKCHLVLFQAPL